MSFFKRNKNTDTAPIPNDSVKAIGNILTYIASGNLYGNASVIRGMEAIGNAISSMKIAEFQIVNGEKKEIDTNLENLLNIAPNDFVSASLFKKQMIDNVFKYGNALVKIDRTLSNEIISLTLLDSRLFACRYNTNSGIPTYFYNGKEIDMSEYLHIFLYPDNQFNGYFGKSLSAHANDVLKNVNIVDKFENKYFSNSCISGILSPIDPARPLPKSQAEEVKKDFINAASSNDGILVMDKQMKYEKVSTNAKDNALLELQQFGVNQIARILNIPACYLFDGTPITEQDQITFFTQTIAPICSIFENEFKRKFFFKKDWNKRSIEFDYESLIKSDRVSLASYYSQLFNLGVISPNEICKKLNLPTSALDGTDSRYILQNAQPIDINLNAVKAGLISE